MVYVKGIREERKIHMKIKSIRTACIILCTTIIVACSIGVNLVTYTGMKGTIKKTNSDYKDAVISGYKEQIKDEVGAMLTVVIWFMKRASQEKCQKKMRKKRQWKSFAMRVMEKTAKDTSGLTVRIIPC